MRDVIAGVVALFLLLFAGSLITTLVFYRKRWKSKRDQLVARGHSVIAEIPMGSNMTLFSENVTHFLRGNQSIDKASIKAVKLLINGSTIAAHSSKEFLTDTNAIPASVKDHPEGIAHDRWDVVAATTSDVILIECGSIRERVSQELAKKIFDAIKSNIRTRDKQK